MKKIIIVGAGITGLSTGIGALEAGYDVTIYEKNQTAGGCCSGWYRDGHYIDNCMHWLTGTNQTTKMFRLWKKIGAIDETSNLYQGKYFYKSHDGDASIALYTDLEQTKHEMIALSPIDSTEIERFISTTKHLVIANQQASFLQHTYHTTAGYAKAYWYYRHLSLADLAKRFQHPLLQKLFTDYLPSYYSSIALLLAYAAFASGNGKVYQEGSLAFTQNILHHYLQLGGKINYNSEVTKVNHSQKAIESIELASGETVQGDYFFFACDAIYVYQQLLPDVEMPKRLVKKLNEKEKYPIPSAFQAAYVVDTKENPIQDTEIIEISPQKIGEIITHRLCLKSYHYLSTTKDAIVYQLMIPQDEVSYLYWKTLQEKSPKAYQQEKEKLATELMKEIVQYFPQLKGHIKLLDSWTPYTYTSYFHAHYGSFMGFSFTRHASLQGIPSKIKQIQNGYVLSIWNNITGGLPIACRMGYYATKEI
ncbi:MAG: FAD-dependent oxidoreductase [Prevotella sp.]|nr:FAD-dependent oxidoreductase [Staphylococcus sp.]MCM1350409.1 FAD-dependent oxidoreductase [Prevotella sp.]